MPAFYTDELKQDVVLPENHQLYNGLDCMMTLEIYEELQREFNQEPVSYRFALALQAPVLEIMLRGFAIDETERRSLALRLRSDIAKLENIINKFAYAVWDRGLNPRSPVQMKDFLYKRMQLPEQWSRKKGQSKLSTDREALEKLEIYFHARPIIAAVLAYRDLAKQLSVIETEVSPDGRMRTSYNIAGTETGRWSSSSSADGTGSNLQNIPPALRRIFIADPDYKLCVIDLEQAESREVGWLCGTLFDDWTYLDACYGGDLHTTTAKLIWPNLDWNGDPKHDRAIADGNFYREYSRRDMSKRGGHGCLTIDHEVLTPSGWVSITEKPPVIMCFNDTRNYQSTSTFRPVSNWLDFEYDGTMIEVDDQAISFKVTEEHRVLGTTCSIKEPLLVYRAGQMPKSIKIVKGWGYRNFGGTVTPDMARFLAAFHADGYQKTTNRCEFHLHKSRKKLALYALCKKLNLEIEEFIVHQRYCVHITLPKDKQDTWPNFNWSHEALEAYIDEYPKWDGHISKTAVCIFSTKLEFIELFQTLARVIGKGGNISKNISGFGSTVYKLQINNRLFATGVQLKKTKERIRVICPTVPSGFFYIRRKGKISVTGNSNYYGKPFTMARHLKVPVKLMEDFQKSYFSAFPAIPKYHLWVAEQLQTTGFIVTPFERKRHFFGRANDDTTLREAIAYSPQSSTADRTNLGLYKIWKRLGNAVQLLAQTHDSVTFQFHKSQPEGEIIAEALKCMRVDLHHNGRTLVVPGEAKVGWNWSSASAINPDGLIKWKGSDTRERHVGLDKVFS